MEKFPVNSGTNPPPASQSVYAPPKHITPPKLQLNPMQNNSGPHVTRRKRKEANEIPMLKLERIIGLTSSTNNMVATDPTSEQIAYAAGAVVVIYNYRRNKQVGFLYPPASVTNAVPGSNNVPAATNPVPNLPAWSLNAHPSAAEWASPSALGTDMNYGKQINDEDTGKKRTSAGTRPKTISCLAFSSDGNFLAAGEVGHQPRIFVWNVKQQSLVCVLKGHKFGIVSVAFSSNMRHLASVGFQHDGYLNVWNWRKGIKVASNRVTSRVNAMSFSKNGSHFITAGLRHIKFWNLNSTAGKQAQGQNNFQQGETQVLDGRSGLLGTLRNNNFVDVICDPDDSQISYLLSETGLLCMFKDGRILDKWVDLQVRMACSLHVCAKYVICACDNGIVRLFEPRTLRYCGMLPRPNPLGVDLSSFVNVQQLDTIKETATYPDTLAIKFDSTSNKVTCIYSDRSLIIWDVKHLQRIAIYRSFISHSECVWGTQMYPQQRTKETKINGNLPPYTFATHSADGTVRFWNIDNALPASDSTLSPTLTSPVSSSPTSYPSLVSPPLSLIASPSMKTSLPSPDQNIHRNIFSKELIKMLYLDPDAMEFAKVDKSIDMPDLPEHGIRALKISSDGKLMATGDRRGNLRVLQIVDWKEITYLEAHDSEILTIDFSTSASTRESPGLIASASRDRLIHVFDIQKDFKLLQTMDDHSSSITAVKFSMNGNTLVSCSADKSVIFRSKTPQQTVYNSYHNHSGRATVFNMELDVHDKYIAMVTGERRLNLLSLESGKLFRSCKPETTEEDAIGMTIENSGGSLIDVDLDPISGTFAVTAGSDKCVRLFDLNTGVCIYKVAAHAELVTSVKFLEGPNGIMRVVSTSSDGSIFVWRLDIEISKKMSQRAKDRTDRAKQSKPDIVVERAKPNIQPVPQLSKPLPRLRRTSAVPMAKTNDPVRAERKSFSHTSKAEAKYDDIYNKLERVSTKPYNDAPASPIPMNRARGRLSTPATRDPKSVVSSASTSRLSLMDMAGNGATSGGATDSVNQAPMRPASNSPRLRHRVSHDVLLQDRQDRKGTLPPSGETAGSVPPRQSFSNAHRTIAHRRSNSSVRLGSHDATDLLSGSGSTSMPDLHAIAEGAAGKYPAVLTAEPDSLCDSDTEKDSIDDNANDACTSVDGDDETLEEESMIFLAPFNDSTIPKPFQVEAADQDNFNDGDDNKDDDATDASAPTEESHADDSDSSSEDNSDDVLVESIAMRNPPPMSTLRKNSLKRSGRMSLRSIVQSFNSLKPVHEPAPSPTTPRSESLTGLKRKMEQAKKRLSFSTRYLSNRGPQDGISDTLRDVPSVKDLSMFIAPLENESPSGKIVRDNSFQKLILTPEELAEINSSSAHHPNSKKSPIPSETAPAQSVKQVAQDPVDHEQMLSTMTAVTDGLHLLVTACQSPEHMQTIGAEAKDHLTTSLLQSQESISAILKMLGHEQPQTVSTSSDTTALLSQYSDMLIQMVENKLNSKQ
ncbi:hypothetical protein INT43_004522 [Umbelopsis isabellina]|uniref:Mitogen-activated protein kinase-binding protein 1 n=1 Tax=Mortierella isabellina TaxID=91625 RepID=A0A8H7PGC4_MORIS|nr:hypothetical protein INT43_004522 [Umbelopsis isabellina]